MLESSRIDCPYCGESIDIDVDCSGGDQQYVEDCPVCCAPIDIAIEVDLDGNLRDVRAQRNDD
jgi:Cysteine-rich CPXCG